MDLCKSFKSNNIRISTLGWLLLPITIPISEFILYDSFQSLLPSYYAVSIQIS